MYEQKVIRQKLAQIEYYDNFKPNVGPKTFNLVKGYHVKNILNLIKEKPSDSDRVLYVACGSGKEIELLGKGIGTDISISCVRNVVSLGFPGIVCDVESLPFKDNSFDYVFSNSMHHFADFKLAFKEIYRVCKKGGRISLGPEAHRYSLDQYIYNTILRYWNTEKGILKLTPHKIIKLFQDHELNNVRYYHKGIDLAAVNPIIEKVFDVLTDILPNILFKWANFYITGIK